MWSCKCCTGDVRHQQLGLSSHLSSRLLVFTRSTKGNLLYHIPAWERVLFTTTLTLYIHKNKIIIIKNHCSRLPTLDFKDLKLAQSNTEHFPRADPGHIVCLMGNRRFYTSCNYPAARQEECRIDGYHVTNRNSVSKLSDCWSLHPIPRVHDLITRVSNLRQYKPQLFLDVF